MNRKTELALTVFVLCAGAVAGWCWMRRPVPEPPPQSVPELVVATQPERIPGRSLPELYGIVEEATSYFRDSQMFLIKSLQPVAGVAESDQNALARQQMPHNYVWVADTIPVLNRDGTPGKINVGQTISAWCGPDVAKTDPPQWTAEFVVIESGHYLGR